MKLFVLLAIVAALTACQLEWRDLHPHADHRITGWTQADLGGGVWADVSVDYEIENTGDVSASAWMVVRAVTADSSYDAATDPVTIEEGAVVSGTIPIVTDGKQATAVLIYHTMPGETESW